jgi:hypothetical protein
MLPGNLSSTSFEIHFATFTRDKTHYLTVLLSLSVGRSPSAELTTKPYYRENTYTLTGKNSYGFPPDGYIQNHMMEKKIPEPSILCVKRNLC